MFSSVAAVEPSLPRRGILQNTVTSALLSQVLQNVLLLFSSYNADWHFLVKSNENINEHHLCKYAKINLLEKHLLNIC